MNLREAHEHLIEEIKDDLLTLGAGYPLTEVSYIYPQLSQCFQALAICHLLENGDQVEYRKNLTRSGLARRHFLRKVQDGAGFRDRCQALSWTEAWMDALVAGHIELARDIGRLSPATWNPDWEYEDDFCYFLFLHMILAPSGSDYERDLSDVLVRFKQVLQGGSSSRLAMCQALLAGDAQGVQDAMVELMAEKEMKDAAEREKMTDTHDPAAFSFWPRSFVSIEGLALIKLARIRNIAIEGEYEFCPALGVLADSSAEVEDPFLQIDRALEQE